MAVSKSRQERRKAHQEKQAATRAAGPSPEPEPPVRERLSPVEQSQEEINFSMMPGGLRSPRLRRSSSSRAKAAGAPIPRSSVTPGPEAAHQNVLLTRYPEQRLDYSTTTRALWRLLMREDHAAHRQMAAEERLTGLPGMLEPGPLLVAVLDELEVMDEEKREERAAEAELRRLGEL